MGSAGTVKCIEQDEASFIDGEKIEDSGRALPHIVWIWRDSESLKKGLERKNEGPSYGKI